MVTSIMNKMEIYWWALLQNDHELATIFLSDIPNNAEITEDIIPQAMLFRHKHKKKDFAYADVIGYALAQRHNIKFLTCNSPFEGLPGVEFVK